MSRLFDALQMSIGGKSDVPFFQAASLEAQLLQSADPDNGVLGQVPTVNIARVAGKLVSMDDGQSLAAEKFRFLAVRLRYIQQKNALKKVLVTSTLSEEGKSFTSVNLAITLSRKQRQKVLLIEGDLRRPGTDCGHRLVTRLASAFRRRNAGLRGSARPASCAGSVPPTGRRDSSVPMPARIRGRTGRKPGRTTCT